MSRAPNSSKPWRHVPSVAIAAFAIFAAPTSKAENQARGANDILSVKGQETAEGATSLAINGTGTPTFTVYKLGEPPRVVIDIAGSKLGRGVAGPEGDSASWELNTWTVGRVTAHERTGASGSSVRVVIDLVRPASYKVTADGSDVRVRVTPRQARPEQAEDDDTVEMRREAAELRRRAEAEARAAEERRQKADRAARRAEKRRAEAEKARERAEREAKAAREVTERERATLAELREARERAEARASEANEASSQYMRARRAANDARKVARARRQAAREAAEKLAERERRGADEEEVAELRAEVRRLSAAARKARQELATQERAVAELRSEVKNLSNQRAQASAELAELEERAEEARARIARAEARQKELAKARRRAEASLARAKEAGKQAEEERARADAVLAEAREARAQAEARHEEAEAKLAEARRARAEADDRRKRASAELEAAKKARAEAEAAREKASADAERSKSRPRIRDVDFVDTGDRARVLVALSAPAEAEIVKATKRQVVLDIPGVSIAEELERTLDTSEFQGPVRAVSSYRHPDKPGVVRVVVQLNQPSRGELEQVGTNLHLEFPKGERRVARNDGERRRERRSGRRAQEPKPDSDSATRAADFPPQIVGNYGAITASRVSPIENCNYRRRTIDLDFKDADIHNLMRLLADVGGVNIVVPDEVKASVTVRLRRVDWAKAMEVILASKGLWYRCDASLVRVATRAELDAEEEAEAERLKALAQSEAPEPEVFTLNYAESSRVRGQLQPLLSPKGRIEVDERTNSLIINDIAAHRRRIIDLLRRLDTQTPQIQIEARIVEARSTYTRELGIQWGGNFISSQETGNDTGLVFPNSVAVGGGADDGDTPLAGVEAVPPNFAVNLPAAVGTGAGGALGLSLGSVGGNFNINLRLSALEEEGTVRIVSAPKITVVNSRQAEISDGVSIPISVISAQGVQTQFVPADLSLRVTPNVSQRDCSISMDINVSNNQPDFANTGARGDPTILRKEARTTILVEDGETSVIGGVYTRNTGVNFSKVPLFGDLPVLGWLFKTKRQNDDRTEVLIFITPKITNRDVLHCEA